PLDHVRRSGPHGASRGTWHRFRARRGRAHHRFHGELPRAARVMGDRDAGRDLRDLRADVQAGRDRRVGLLVEEAAVGTIHAFTNGWCRIPADMTECNPRTWSAFWGKPWTRVRSRRESCCANY